MNKFINMIYRVLLLLYMNLGILYAQDALVMYRNSDYDKAIEITLEEIKQFPYNVDSYVVLGWSLLYAGRYTEALQYTRLGIQNIDRDYRLVGIIAEASFHLKKYDDFLLNAHEYLETAINNNSYFIFRNAQMYYYVASYYMKNNNYNYAYIAIETAIAIYNKDIRFINLRAILAELKNDKDSAHVHYQNALAIKNTDFIRMAIKRTKNNKKTKLY